MTRHLCQVNLYPITAEQGPLDQIFDNRVDCCTLRARWLSRGRETRGRRVNTQVFAPSEYSHRVCDALRVKTAAAAGGWRG